MVGLAVTALPVLHGADYTCYGFAFGPPQERVVYLSDYTALLPQTDALLASWSSGGEAIHTCSCSTRCVPRAATPPHLPPPWPRHTHDTRPRRVSSGSHPVHATLSESVELARRLRPRYTRLVGVKELPTKCLLTVTAVHRRTLLVGMGHALEHHATNRRLRRLWREEQLDVQLAFDGMFVPLPGLDVG